MNRFANIYELLGDENDETPRQVGQAAQRKEEPTKKTAPGAAKGQQAKPAKGAQASDQKGRAPQQQRSIDRRPREFSAPVGDQEVDRKRENRPPREQRDRDPERRQRTAEALGPRGNQRVFDRRSGTGRGRENKRSGGGRGNWGTVEDDKKAQTEKGETQETEVSAEPKETTEQAPQEPAVEAVPEEEDNTKTLSEYLTQIKKPVHSLPEARRANEGNDSQWSKFKPLTRQFEEDTFFKAESADKEVKKEGSAESKDESKKTVRADEVLKFTDSPKPQFGRGGKRGGRGGRGGDRGGRGGDRGGRGGDRGGRGGRTGGNAPNYKDESAFPSLSPAPVKA